MRIALVSFLIASSRMLYSVWEIWRGRKLGVEALRLMYACGAAWLLRARATSLEPNNMNFLQTQWVILLISI